MTGVLIEVLVLRLNPAITVTTGVAFTGFALWSVWGMVIVGIPLVVLGGIAKVFRSAGPSPSRWRLPEVFCGAYVVLAVLTYFNARVHVAFLTGSGHKTLKQDGVAWLLVGLLVLWIGSWLRRRQLSLWWRWVYAGTVLLLPLVRLLGYPGEPRQLEPIPATALGAPQAALLVIGVEGLDAGVFFKYITAEHYPHLTLWVTEGAWGSLKPYRPFLQRSLWTTTAVGAFPRRHGLKAKWAWRIPGGFSAPVQLLPWFPISSRWMVPWVVAHRQPPPAPLLPTLWQRLEASQVSTAAINWPGEWWSTASRPIQAPQGELAQPDESLREALQLAVASFKETAGPILAAVDQDISACREARRALGSGASNVWVFLESLGVVRRNLEPLKPRHVREREVMQRYLELLDEELGALLEALPANGLAIAVSPYGMEPPDSRERLLRLIGAQRDWRASPRSCPDGFVSFLGPSVIPGHRLKQAQVVDVVPTACYLLGLPLAQYMEGRVLLDAVEPDYIASYPLRVVD